MNSTEAFLTLHLRGAAVERNRIALADLADVMAGLQSAVLRVAEVLAGKQESGRRGPTTSEIADNCVLEITALLPGSVGLAIDLRPPSQPHLLEDRHLGPRAVEQLVSGIGVIDDTDTALPMGYDKGVVKAVVDMTHVLDHGVDEFTLALGGRPHSRSATINRDKRETLSARVHQTVIRNRVVEGRLLMGDFRETGYHCRIHPAASTPIRCTFEEEQRGAVLAAMTKHVRVQGEATERNGNIAKLHIDNIVPVALQPDTLDSVLSIPFDAEFSLAELAAQQGVEPIKSIDDLRMATWPEDESVDDLVATVRAWRDEDGQRERA